MGRYPQSQTALESLMQRLPGSSGRRGRAHAAAWRGPTRSRAATASRSRPKSACSRATARERRRRIVSSAMLDIAHVRFNQKRFREAAAAYEDFLRRYPNHPSVATRRSTRRDSATSGSNRAGRRRRPLGGDRARQRDSTRSRSARGRGPATSTSRPTRYADARALLQRPARALRLAARRRRSRTLQARAVRVQRRPRRGRARDVLARPPSTSRHAGGARGAARHRAGALPPEPEPDRREASWRGCVEQFPSSAFAADAQFQIARRAYDEKRWTMPPTASASVVSQFPSYSARRPGAVPAGRRATRARSKLDDARTAYEQFLSFFPQSELRPDGSVPSRAHELPGEGLRSRRGGVHARARRQRVGRSGNGRALQPGAVPPRCSDRPTKPRPSWKTTAPLPGRRARRRHRLPARRSSTRRANRLEDAKREYEQSLAVEAVRRASPSELAVPPRSLLRAARRRGTRRSAHYRLAAATRSRPSVPPVRGGALRGALRRQEATTRVRIEAYRDLIRNAKDRDLVVRRHRTRVTARSRSAPAASRSS